MELKKKELPLLARQVGVVEKNNEFNGVEEEITLESIFRIIQQESQRGGIELEDLYERFYTTKEEVKSNNEGLTGLSVSAEFERINDDRREKIIEILKELFKEDKVFIMGDSSELEESLRLKEETEFDKRFIRDTISFLGSEEDGLFKDELLEKMNSWITTQYKFKEGDPNLVRIESDFEGFFLDYLEGLIAQNWLHYVYAENDFNKKSYDKNAIALTMKGLRKFSENNKTNGE